MQGRLFPLEICRVEPANLGTATLRTIGIGCDGLAYALKRCEDGHLLPASELLCTRLAASCDLPVPVGEIANLPNGRQAFASRWEGGTLADQQSRPLIASPGAVSASILSAIFAFDLFVGNPDRHPGNYLLRRDSYQAAVSLLAFDFGHAFLMAGWPIPLPPTACNTRLTARILFSQVHPFDMSAAQRVLDRLRALPDDTLGRLCQDLPSDWLLEGLAAELNAWWANGRADRITQIIEVIRRDVA